MTAPDPPPSAPSAYPPLRRRERPADAAWLIPVVSLLAAVIALIPATMNDPYAARLCGTPIAALDLLASGLIVLVLWFRDHENWSPNKQGLLLLVGLVGPALAALALCLNLL